MEKALGKVPTRMAGCLRDDDTDRDLAMRDVAIVDRGGQIRGLS